VVEICLDLCYSGGGRLLQQPGAQGRRPPRRSTPNLNARRASPGMRALYHHVLCITRTRLCLTACKKKGRTKKHGRPYL